jgi:hypothetical protein
LRVPTENVGFLLRIQKIRRQDSVDTRCRVVFERRGDVSRRRLVESAEAAAKKAIALDPEYAGGKLQSAS